MLEQGSGKSLQKLNCRNQANSHVIHTCPATAKPRPINWQRLVLYVPPPHLAWTARPSTIDFEFGWTRLHTLQLRNFCRQLPNQILLLDEPALRAGGISFGLDVHDVVASPLRKAVDAVNERALLAHDDFTLPARLPSVSCRRAER